MKSVSKSVIWLFLLLFPVLAYSKVDFTGQWSFDKSESKFDEGGDRFAPVRINVVQLDGMMTIEFIYQREYADDFVDTLMFSLDGKENYSEFWTSPRTITAQWSDDEQLLIINTKIVYIQDSQEQELYSTDVWRFADDRSKMLRDFTFDGPLGILKAHYVFNRIQ